MVDPGATVRFSTVREWGAGEGLHSLALVPPLLLHLLSLRVKHIVRAAQDETRMALFSTLQSRYIIVGHNDFGDMLAASKGRAANRASRLAQPGRFQVYTGPILVDCEVISLTVAPL